MRWQGEAMEAMQHAAETMLTERFIQVNDTAIHAGRVTIFKKDSLFVSRFLRNMDPNHPMIGDPSRL